MATSVAILKEIKIRVWEGAKIVFPMPTPWEDFFLQLILDILRKYYVRRLCKTEKSKKLTPNGYENRSPDANPLGGLFYGSLHCAFCKMTVPTDCAKQRN